MSSVRLIQCILKISESFWKRVAKKEHDDCWEWQGSRKKDRGKLSYGRLYIPTVSKKLGSHQVAFILANGYLPEQVNHTCNNPPCCNPRHLQPGSHESNMVFMKESNRSLFGERNPKAKLTESDVRAILADRTSTNKALAEIFGVTHSMISAIRLRKSWRHVS